MDNENKPKKIGNYRRYHKKKSVYNKNSSESSNIKNDISNTEKTSNVSKSNNYQSKLKNKKYRFRKKTVQKKEPITYDICSICSEVIREPLTAIPDKISSKNAHFECIVLEIKKANIISTGEKIYYLGGGRFGIVQERRVRNRLTYSIREKIQYIDKPLKRSYNEKKLIK
ncbi:MAG: hypothetical protein OEV44_01505 [Spirochaetota bacterium]|nr:hypothetical protein [Spirochaetota bacterium]